MKRDSNEVPLCTPQLRLEVGNSSRDEMIGFNFGTLRNDINVPM